MRKIYTLLFALCSLNLSAQIIDFPDPNFKNALLSNGVDTSGDDRIDVAEAAAVTELNLVSSAFDISDMTGIEFFTSLVDLEIHYQDIVTLDLSMMTDIIQLRLVGNDLLETVDVSNISSISFRIQVKFNPSLLSFDLPVLTDANSILIEDNLALTSVDLSGLETGGTVTLIDNTALVDFDISSLESIGTLFVKENTGITRVELPVLSEVSGRVDFNGETSLTTLNMPGLVNIEGNIEVRETGLGHIEVPNLVSCGAINISSNEQLLEIDLPQLASLTSGISIWTNLALTSFKAPLLSTPNYASFTFNYELAEIIIPSLSVITDRLSIEYSPVTELLLPNLTNVQNRLIIDPIALTELDLSSLISADKISIDGGILESIDLSNLTTTNVLNLDQNELTELSLPSLQGSLEQLDIRNNNLQDLELGAGVTLIQNVRASFNDFTAFDLTGIQFDLLDIGFNDIRTLFIKNGGIASFIILDENPLLQYVCTDEVEYDYIAELLDAADLDNVEVNDYCSFSPGGDFYTIEGNVLYDFDSGACEISDVAAAFEQIELTSDVDSGITYTNADGFYTFYVTEPGVYTVSPVLSYAPLFFTSPPAYTITVPDDIPDIEIPYEADFCLAPNGLIDDIAVTIVPTSVARPGFDASYALIAENVGNSRLDGRVSFTYDDSILDLVSTSEPMASSSDGFLTFDFVNLEPFELFVIDIVLNANAPTEDPPVNNGDVLSYTANVTPDPDANPEDNTFVLDQVVVGSYDPNDKTCLQGETITPQEVGEYVDYLIRFENTGTFAAENVVVTDTINTDYFQLQSLRVIGASHDFVTRVTDNFVEFIFEDINLPFDDANNDGYVLFKIRTLETLEVGDTFSNKAAIYFDFNFPIITNDAVTTIEEPLSVHEFNADSLRIYPNPALEILSISGLENSELKSLQVYNLQGQLLIDNQLEANTIDVSGLSSGVYFLKINTAKGSVFKRFLKN